LARSQDLDNHSILNTAESNWDLVAGLVRTVESMDLVPIKRKVGDHLREREDGNYVIIAKDRDILLRNSLVEVLFVFFVNP
jgi:hypothetical protein